MPPKRGVAVVHRVDRAVGGRGGKDAPGCGGRDAKAGLLALHVAAGLRAGRRRRPPRRPARAAAWRPPPRPLRCRGRPPAGLSMAHKERASLSFVPDAVPEGEAAGHRDEQQGDHLEEVGKRVRVFKGVRRVDPEEAAAVGSQLFDRDLAGGWAERDDLPGNGGAVLQHNRLEQIDGVIGRERLYDALGGDDEHDHDGQRDEDVEGHPHKVGPEAAEPGGFHPRESPDKREHHGDSRRGRDEVLHCQPERLREVGEGALPE